MHTHSEEGDGIFYVGGVPQGPKFFKKGMKEINARRIGTGGGSNQKTLCVRSIDGF